MAELDHRPVCMGEEIFRSLSLGTSRDSSYTKNMFSFTRLGRSRHAAIVLSIDAVTRTLLPETLRLLFQSNPKN